MEAVQKTTISGFEESTISTIKQNETTKKIPKETDNSIVSLSLLL